MTREYDIEFIVRKLAVDHDLYFSIIEDDHSNVYMVTDDVDLDSYYSSAVYINSDGSLNAIVSQEFLGSNIVLQFLNEYIKELTKMEVISWD